MIMSPMSDELKVKLFRRHVLNYIWCKANKAFHNDIIPTVKHGGGSVTALPDMGDGPDGTMNSSLPESPEGKCSPISLRANAQA